VETEHEQYVESLETCRDGHEYVVMLLVNSDGTGSSYAHEDSMAYCPQCGSPSEALDEDEPGVSGEELEEVRSFYELISIRVNDEAEEKQRHVHVDVIENRREEQLSG
jgi:hypothetical protein